MNAGKLRICAQARCREVFRAERYRRRRVRVGCLISIERMTHNETVCPKCGALNTLPMEEVMRSSALFEEAGYL